MLGLPWRAMSGSIAEPSSTRRYMAAPKAALESDFIPTNALHNPNVFTLANNILRRI
jgi:hypothetical protein